MEVGPPCAVDDLLVTRVLRDGAFHLGCRDGEDVAVCIKVAARLGTTLVAPVVVVVATKASEADERRAAETLIVELAAPLVAEVAQRVG